jgi:hypothetical protein
MSGSALLRPSARQAAVEALEFEEGQVVVSLTADTTDMEVASWPLAFAVHEAVTGETAPRRMAHA